MTKAGFLPLIALALVVVAPVGVHAGETRVEFEKRAFQKMGITPAGRKTRGLTFEHTARRDTAGTPDLLSVETMTVVGGVIFVEVARPAAPEYACPTLGIDLAAPTGQRLRVAFDTASVAANLHDWELVPLAAFVKSGSDALFTYMGVHGEYHEAFAGNLVGFNLFLLDTFRSLNKPSEAHRMVKTVVPGYTHGVAEPSGQATRKLTRWMRRSHLMFTDFEVDFAFRPNAGHLAIDGEPYWMAVSGMGASARIDRRFEDSETTLAANPAVFGSGFRLAKHAAFFRYLKTDCPGEWRILNERLHASRGALDLYTIPLRRMPYAVRS